MRRTAAALLLAMGALSARAEAPAPRPFTAAYQVTYRGIGAGSLNFSFEREPGTGRYVYETRANPSALARLVVSSAAVERSIMEIDAHGVRPIEWRLDDGRSGDKGDGELKFDWEKGVATGWIEREDIRLPLEPGLQDRQSITIAVATALLRGEEPGTYPLIDDNRVKRYTYTMKGRETIESKLGPLETIIYESTRPGSSRVTRLWLAPELDYAAVRAEQIRRGRVETVMVLTHWEAAGG